MKQETPEELLEFAIGVGRRVGRYKLHADECDSAAGMAVATVLHKFAGDPRPRPLIVTVLSRLIWKEAMRNSRYEHPKEGWWARRLAGDDPRGLLLNFSEERTAVLDLHVTGYKAREIATTIGISAWRVRQHLEAVAQDLRRVSP